MISNCIICFNSYPQKGCKSCKKGIKICDTCLTQKYNKYYSNLLETYSWNIENNIPLSLCENNLIKRTRDGVQNISLCWDCWLR